MTIPTRITAQPNILFNTDNIATVVPPAVDTVNMVAGAGNTGQTTITVTSTTGLAVGMVVTVTSAGSTGVFVPGTTVVSFTSNSFVVSTAPTTTLLAATISAATPFCTLHSQGKGFRISFGGKTALNQNANAILGSNIINNSVISALTSPTNSVPNFGGDVTLTNCTAAVSTPTITVNSTAGLAVGMLVTLVGGSGVLPANTYVASITSETVFVVSNNLTTAMIAANPATLLASSLYVTAIAVV